MEQKIELAKARDFGEIINDTFTFVKQNFKPLFRAVFVFSGFFLLVIVVLQYLQQSKIMGWQQRVQTDPDVANSFNTPSVFGIEYFLILIFHFATQAILIITVLSYMALYKEKGNVIPSTMEVWERIKFYFFRVIGSSIIIAIIIGIGFVFCFIPGVWLTPILSLVFPIIIFENTSFGYAFNRSFTIIKENWWATFGVLFVMFLIMSFGAGIFAVPGLILTAILAATQLHNATSIVIPIALLMAAIQTLGYVLITLPIVSLALCYFNLNEKREGTGLLDRINSFGKKPDTDLPAEEY